MSVRKKKIEFFQIAFKTTGDFSFGDLLQSNQLSREQRIKGKNVSLTSLRSGKKYFVGLVETSRNENIPPKKNRRSKTLSRLGLSEDEGLAYANVFLFEYKRGILIYEVNKFGCSVDHFSEFVYKCFSVDKQLEPFDIKINPILNSHEYQRVMKMPFIKSISFRVAFPKQIVLSIRDSQEAEKHKNDALFNALSSAASVDSDRVDTTYEVNARSSVSGLTKTPSKSIIQSLLRLRRGALGDNVQRIEVAGYEEDDSDNLHKINLLADAFIREIELDEPRENTDLLQSQRQREIEVLYDNCVDDLTKILGE